MMIEKVSCKLTFFEVFLKEVFEAKVLKELLKTETEILKEIQNA